MALSEKHERFVREYLVDLNAAAAYLRAGYKAKSPAVASANAARLIASDSIQARVAELARAQHDRLEVTADRVLAAIAAIAFSDPRRFYNPDGSLKAVSELADEEAAALAQVEVFEEFEGSGKSRKRVGKTSKVKLCDKLS